MAILCCFRMSGGSLCLTFTAKKQLPRSTSTTVPATLPVLLKALQPSDGEAMLSVYCCPNRLLMDEPKEACMTCRQRAQTSQMWRSLL